MGAAVLQPRALIRLSDWEPRLRAWHREASAGPFVWGVSDCALSAGDAVLAQTGVDPVASLRGRYKTAKGAAGVLKRHGGLEAMLTARLGEPLRSPLLAQRGFVVLFLEGEDERVGVIVNPGWIACKAPDGMTRRPLSAAVMAWAIG